MEMEDEPWRKVLFLRPEEDSFGEGSWSVGGVNLVV
jgi:hypothetical protein